MAAKPSILVADDDPEWRRLISYWLERTGYHLQMTGDGKSVLTLAKQAAPDCFVLDHDMGDITGNQICQALKSDPQFKKIPVIILTAHAQVLNELNPGLPPDHFIVKSNNPDELLAVLATIFPDRR